MKRHLLLTPAFLLIAACGAQSDDPASDGVTRAEADQLNKAAEKLNQDEPPPRITQGDLPKAPAPPAEAQ